MRKLILIDGSSILNSCFYGTIPTEYFLARNVEEKRFVLKRVMHTRTGVFTNGVYAMTRVLIRLIEKERPSHMAVSWDVSRDTLRRKLFSGYKAHRLDPASELSAQITLMREVLDDADIAQFSNPDAEANDLIGSLSKKFENEIPVFILSKDKDLLQLVSEHTHLWLITGRAKELRRKYRSKGGPEGTCEFTPEIVKEVYGVTPSQIADMKALEGDPSDSIPGIYGVGEKAALSLLKQFGNIEAIYEAMEDVNGFKDTCSSLGIRLPLKALIGGREVAFLSKILASIKRDYEINNTLQDLQLRINHEKVQAKFTELEFTRLIKPQTTSATEMPHEPVKLAL